MKTLTQIINEVFAQEQILKDPTASSNRKINNIKNPTSFDRRHTFKRRHGLNADGNLIKASVLRKDTTAAYKNTHPGQFGMPGNRKVISPIQAQQMVDKKVNIRQIIANRTNNKKIQKWGISNSQKKHVEYHPHIGPQGTFFEIT